VNDKLTFAVINLIENPIAANSTCVSIKNCYEENQIFILNEKTFAKAFNKIFNVVSEGFVYFIIAGKYMPKNIIEKYNRLIGDPEKTILYAVEDRKPVFYNNSLSGLYLNVQTLNKIGKFPENIDETKAKILWASTTLNMNIKLKSIVGARTV
jgi:hypothetical protein